MGLATREAFGQKIAELIKENDKIVVLDADLAKSTKTTDARKAVPERCFDIGIAEADMIGTAAGLAASGYIPFACTFAMFATGRAWEQIRNSVAYPHLNVKVIGSHAGIAVGEDGVSHQAIEDIAIMRAIPGMTVYSPCDSAETKACVAQMVNEKKPSYLRLGRSSVDDVYAADEAIDVTKIHTLRKGKKVAVFATGLMVQAVLAAADKLKAEGIEVTVADVCCIKPIDEAAVLDILNSHEQILTAEEHNVFGGLGSAIAEIAAEKCPRPIHRIGLYDSFAESGDFKLLLKKYKLDAEAMETEIRTAWGK